MIDINKFSGQGDDVRTWINKPFAINGSVCATNGNIIMILHNQDCSGYAELETNKSVVMKIIDAVESASDYASVDKDKIVFPEKIDCSICKGCGHATKEKCVECKGEGVVEASNDFNTYYDLKCGTCQGIGYETDTLTEQTCTDCEGTGEAFEEHVQVEILGVRVQAKYLILIIELPGLQFCVSKDKRMLMFKAGEDTFGVIMCCSWV